MVVFKIHSLARRDCIRREKKTAETAMLLMMAGSDLLLSYSVMVEAGILRCVDSTWPSTN